MQEVRPMRDLTNRQLEMLAALKQYIDDNGYPPSHRQLADVLGMRSTSGVAMRLDALEREGDAGTVGVPSRGRAKFRPLQRHNDERWSAR